MQASKAADTYGLFEGHSIEQADSRQAYTQSKLGGAATWAFYPVMSGPKNGRTCVIPYARHFYRYTDIPIRGDIGSNAAKGMLRPKGLWN
eukprot:2919295-Pyramimonas_sp.AAC.1